MFLRQSPTASKGCKTQRVDSQQESVDLFLPLVPVWTSSCRDSPPPSPPSWPASGWTSGPSWPYVWSPAEPSAWRRRTYALSSERVSSRRPGRPLWSSGPRSDEGDIHIQTQTNRERQSSTVAVHTLLTQILTRASNVDQSAAESSPK